MPLKIGLLPAKQPVFEKNILTRGSKSGFVCRLEERSDSMGMDQ
jgi:hypothetical protein